MLRYLVQYCHCMYKANQSIKNIARNIDITVLAVQIWIKKFRDGNGVEISTHVKLPRLAKKVSFHTANFAKCQVKGNPQISARVIRESNPSLIGDVSIRTAKQLLHEDLGYHSH